MAVTISSYKAYGVYIDEPITTRALQVLNLVVSQAAADATMDVANPAGTFWTSAILSSKGPAALAALQQIQAKAESRISWCSPQIQDAYTQVPGAPAADTDYQITTTSIVPSIAFKAAKAPTAATLNLVIVLGPQQRAVRAGDL